MAFPTRWYSSTMQGAPTLSGTAGDMITLLDAVLVNGFGTLTLTSLAVTSSVATATYSGGHSYKQWSVIEIAGASPPGLNGPKRILTTTATQFTFDATGISDGVAVGTITAKLPAAGWTKAYSGTNLAAYLMDTVVGTGGYLRVDDTGTTDSRVVGYMAMSDVDTGTDPFPTAAQVSGGGYLRKSSVASSTTRVWTMMADDRAFYIGILYDGSSAYRVTFFGDLCSFYSGGGPWDCMMSMAKTNTGNNGMGYADGSTTTQACYIPRLFAATAGAVAASKKGLVDYSAYTGWTYPSPITGGFVASDSVLILEGAATAQARGVAPGFVLFMNNCAAGLTWDTPILLSGFASYILPMPTGQAAAPWFGVSLGSWR